MENKTMNKKVLEVNDLVVQYRVSEKGYFNAVNNISFDVHKGEVVGLVGESGSGKSTTAKSILGLTQHSAGNIKIDDEFVPNRLKDNKGKINKWLASKVQMIFQDAKSSLNSKETVFKVIVEGAKNQKLYEKQKNALINKAVRKFINKNRKLSSTKTYKLLNTELKYK